MAARKRLTFKSLTTFALERAYTVRRRGREVHWSRNGDARVFVSYGVSDAHEDILLDCSSKKPGLRGTK